MTLASWGYEPRVERERRHFGHLDVLSGWMTRVKEDVFLGPDKREVRR